MNFESSYNLVKYWNEINFFDFELIKNDKSEFSIVIENKVKIQYPHYNYAPMHKQPFSKSIDVYYYKIEQFIVEKYLERLIRMKDVDPIFIFATANFGKSRHAPFSKDEQYQLESLHSKYKIIMSFNEMIESKQIYCIKQTKIFDSNNNELAKLILDDLVKNGIL
jgi:hypothetical protein